ncbi:hypothetical protein ACFTXM_41665 [Streptomyces sp. NPDC056930]
MTSTPGLFSARSAASVRFVKAVAGKSNAVSSAERSCGRAGFTAVSR